MVSKKRLLVTASTFPRWEGDTEPRFVLDLSKHMLEEFDVTVLVPAAPGAKDNEILEGINVIRYHYFPIHKWETLCYPGAIVPRIKEKKVRVLLVPFLFLSLWFHLFKLLPQFDIVHAHWLIPQGIVQSFFKKPYIVTGHGGDVTSLNKGICRKLKIRCLQKATHVTVVSKPLKDIVQELVPELDVSVISMGVDTKKFDRKYYKSDYFGQNGKKVVLFVGRLAEKKGVCYLIEAMKNVDALLVIVGDGPLRKVLEEQAKALGDKVRFLGSKTHEELKTVYASADIFVAPSITADNGDKEGLGLVILEAMTSGLAVVASDSGGIAQIVENGKNGILVKEKDSRSITGAINKILENEEFAKTIVENSKKKIKEYDYSEIAGKYAKLISEQFDGIC